MVKPFVLLCFFALLFIASPNHIYANNNKPNGSYAPFDMAITAVTADCVGNGELQINISNAAIGGVFEFAVFVMGDNTPFRFDNNVVANAASFQRSITALPANNYRLTVTQTFGGVSTPITEDFIIDSTFEAISYTVNQVETCAGADITVNVSAGIPVSYQLLEEGTNAVIVAEQASNIFNGIAVGSYTVRVKDSCGNIDNRAITVAQRTYTTNRADPTINNQNGSLFGFKVLKDCNTISHREQLLFNGEANIPDLFFPIAVTYTIANPTGGPATVINATWTSNADNNQEIDIPYYDGEQYDYTVAFVDNCGNPSSFTDTIGTTAFDFVFSKLGAACSGSYLPIWRFEWGLPPYNVAIITAPTGFDPSAFNNNFAPGSNTATFPGSTQLGSFTNPLPPGDYQIQVTDACGKSANRTKRINPVDPASINHNLRERGNYGGCTPDNGSIRFYVRNNTNNRQVADLTSVNITNAPTTYTGPTDVSAFIDADGRFAIDALPAGSYTFEGTTDCGTTPTGTFEIRGAEITSNAEVILRCGSFDLNYTINSNFGYEQLYVQIFDETSGQWAHPETGQLYTEGTLVDPTTGIFILEDDDEIESVWDNDHPNNYFEEFNNTINLLNIGEYRIIANHSVFENPSTLANCSTVVDSFSVTSFDIILHNYFTPFCTDGSRELIIDASGAGPLTYRITHFDDTPMLIDNGNNPIFTNLENGEYRVEIEDSCLNVRTFLFRTNDVKMPVITPENLCNGESGTLSVNSPSFIEVTWTKDNDPTVLGTTNVLVFDPYEDGQLGSTYYANLSFTPDVNACINQRLSFTLQDTPANAGQGQTVNLLVNDVGIINLANYITPPFDNWGTWTNNSGQGSLVDNFWDATNLGIGSYTFTYNVRGLCIGTANTTVTINLVDMLPNALIAQADNITIACDAILGDTIGNVITNDTSNGTPVDAADYTITLENTNTVFDIATDGTITVIAGVEAGVNYTLSYRITDNADASNFAIGTLTITVSADTDPPLWTTAANSLDVNLECEDTAGLAAAQALFPEAIDNCDTQLGIATKVSTPFTDNNCTNVTGFINTWTITDASGNISETFTQTIRIVCGIKVHNLITANGDGKNDVLFIEGIACFPDNVVKVFNRWGNMVYEATGYNNTTVVFNATSSASLTINESKLLPTGTYYYVVEYQNGTEKTALSGWLSITNPD